MKTEKPHRRFRGAPLRHLLQKRVLVMMVGVPGSGKSYFSRQLAACLGMVRVNGDALRTELYGHPEPLRQSFSDRRCQTALRAGFSVVRDHMHHHCHHRLKGKRMADEVAALPVVVWIKTPHDLAIRRSLNRELSYDQFPKRDMEFARESVDKWHAKIELPLEEGIACLQLDGRLLFAQQLEKFTEFVRRCEQKDLGAISN